MLPHSSKSVRMLHACKSSLLISLCWGGAERSTVRSSLSVVHLLFIGDTVRISLLLSFKDPYFLISGSVYLKLWEMEGFHSHKFRAVLSGGGKIEGKNRYVAYVLPPNEKSCSS